MSTVLPVLGVLAVLAGFIWYKIKVGATAQADLTEANRKQDAEDAAAAEQRQREADERAKEAKEILAIPDPVERRRRSLLFLLKSGRSSPSV